MFSPKWKPSVPDRNQHVSLSEIERVSGDALRMLGLPVGHADDAAQAFVWTQVALARGYDCIRLADVARPAAGWPRPTVKVVDEISIDLGDTPLLFYANRIVDFILACDHPCKIKIERTLGGWALAFIAYRLSQSGVSSVSHWLPARELFEDAPAMSVTGVAGKSEIIVAASAGALRLVDNQLQRTPQSSQHDHIRSSTDGEIDAGSCYVVLRGSFSGTTHETAVSSMREMPTGEMETVSISPDLCFRSATEKGLVVASVDQKMLSELVRRRWLPTSERSRQQAG